MKFQLAASVFVFCGLASATTMHVVTLGKGGQLKFCPEQITAAPGDLVQFQYYPKNHSVVQGFFAKGCTPISEAPPPNTAPGIFSGFMPVAANATEIPTFTITVNGTGPEWFYCSQAMHCQSGMVFAINPTTQKTLDGYKANCANATQNITPGQQSPPPQGPPPPSAAPTSVPTTPSIPQSTASPSGQSTALPVHQGSMASTLSRTGSWAVVGLAGCLTYMMML